jgi:hypothetical protein
MSEGIVSATPEVKLSRKERALQNYRRAKARLQKLEAAERKAERVLQQEGPNSDVAKLVAARRWAMRETQECGRTKSPHRKAADATTS